MATIYSETFAGVTDNTNLNGLNGWTALTTGGSADSDWDVISEKAAATTNGARFAYRSITDWTPVRTGSEASVSFSRYTGTGARGFNTLIIGATDASSYANINSTGIVAWSGRSDHATNNSYVEIYDGGTLVANKSTTFQIDGSGHTLRVVIETDGSGTLYITQGVDSDSVSWGPRTWTNGGGQYYGVNMDFNGSDGTGRTTRWQFDDFTLNYTAPDPYQIIPLGAPLEFDTTQAFEKSTIKLSDTRFVIIWKQTGTVMYCQAFDINLTTGAITALSSPLNFYTAGSATGQGVPTGVMLDSTHFAIFWAGADQDGFCRTFQVNAGTGAITTWGAQVEYDTADGQSPAPVLMDSTHILNAWAGTSNGKAQVFSVNMSDGTLAAIGSAYTFGGGSILHTGIVKLSATKAAVFYMGSASDGYGLVLDVNTSTWAVTAAGSEFEYQDGITCNSNSPIIMRDAGSTINVMLFFGASAGTPTGRILLDLSINTSTWAITAVGSTQSVFSITGDGGLKNPMVPLDSTHFWLGTQGTDNDGFVQTWSVDTSTGAMSLLDEIEIATVDGFAMSALDFGNGLIVNAYSGTDLDGFVRAYQVVLPEQTATAQLMMMHMQIAGGLM